MKVVYYPGCTLPTKASNFESSFLAVAEKLDIEIVEIEGWTCCGAVFPLVTDNIMNLVAPARNLAKARKLGDKVTTLCAFCYNVLKRTNRVIREDKEKREKLNLFLEEDYEGDLKIVHPLEILRDDIGFENLKIEKALDLKVAPYYGCKLLRPFDEIGMDSPEAPTIFEDFLRAVGCEPVIFPQRTKCCGSYLSVSSTDVAIGCSDSILNSALENGADAMALTCPLCLFNLELAQKSREGPIKEIPVFYFTELLGLALGLEIKIEKHFSDPLPLLESKNICSCESIANAD
ncbi:MAG: CoB--CoM heterodisulfide reductase iron-sulfur subunit B family protein [Halobacteriota archaeon]|nr:CoB--CoM heterodisulfide reductase iron-sulfur subunit B family protein [Halobacteriota archaeon]